MTIAPTSPTATPAAAQFQRLPDLLAERPCWSRSTLYRLAAEPEYHGLFRKMGRLTWVDLALLDKIEARLPAAHIRRDPSRRPPAALTTKAKRRIRQPELVAPSEF